MSDGQALLQAILVDPEDNSLRLVYADWLEERGDPRGEFIRVQVTRASLTPEAPQWRPLWNRELALIRAHKEVWFGAIRKRFVFWECRRGFIDEVSTSETVLRETMVDLFHTHPVQMLSVRCALASVPWLLALPLLNGLSRLCIWTAPPRDVTEGSVEAIQRMIDARPVGRSLNLHRPGGGLETIGGAQRLRSFDILLDKRPVPDAERLPAQA